MARNGRKLTAGDLQVVNRAGKLKQVTIALTGDRVFAFHDGTTDAAPVIYKVDMNTDVNHKDLELQFATGLFVDLLVAGTVGEINILYE